MNRKAFYDSVRASLFSNSLSADQVAGMETILNEAEGQKVDQRWLTYMLATAFHETAKRMQPIREFGRGRGKKYGVAGRFGQVAYGRGLVQLTWDDNYERADRELGLNGALTKNFDLALQADIAVKIMFRGMIAGWFTGKKLADYEKPTGYDYQGARAIINGKDCAYQIAGYARAFAAALAAASYQ